jgi:hypothetical protein
MTMGVVEEIIQRSTPAPTPPPRERPWEADYEALLGRVIEAVGEHRELVWGTMTYACHGQRERSAMPENVIQEGIKGGYLTEAQAEDARKSAPPAPPCGHEHKIWLGVGIEGPSELRAIDLYLASPFSCGRCPQCGGEMVHVRFQDDERFDPCQRPEGVRYFILPTVEQAKANAEKGYHGAEFVEVADG